MGELKDLFQYLYKQFNKNLPYVPADWACGILERQRHPEFRRETPFLYSIALRGKEHPWKTICYQLWASRTFNEKQMMAKLSEDDDSLASPAARAYHRLLKDAIMGMRKVDRTKWKLTTSRHVCHHSGWIPLMNFFRMLSQDTGVPGFKVSFQGVAEYTIVPYDEKVHLNKFRSAHRAQSVLNSFPVMETFSDWMSYASIAVQFFSLQKVPGANDGGYSTMWYIRSDFIIEMRAKGVKKLAFNKNVQADRLTCVSC
jgi:hypothetical protein